MTAELLTLLQQEEEHLNQEPCVQEWIQEVALKKGLAEVPRARTPHSVRSFLRKYPDWDEIALWRALTPLVLSGQIALIPDEYARLRFHFVPEVE